MMYRGIFIDGNEPHRRNRLAEVVDDLPISVRSRIKSLYDHKGSLTVRWFLHMYEKNRAVIVEQAWNRQCECLIAHVTEHDDIDHDTFPFNAFEPARPI